MNVIQSHRKMKRLATFLAVVVVLACCKKEASFSDACIDIIESDSFYYAMPLGGEDAIKTMFDVENFLPADTSSNVQTIDFDCAVVVSPTKEQMDELKRMHVERFGEIYDISIRHSEAFRCIAEANGIRSITATQQVLRFVGNDQTWHLDMGKHTFSAWKFILFKRDEKPLILPNVGSTLDQLEQYFGREIGLPPDGDN